MRRHAQNCVRVEGDWELPPLHGAGLRPRGKSRARVAPIPVVHPGRIWRIIPRLGSCGIVAAPWMTNQTRARHWSRRKLVAKLRDPCAERVAAIQQAGEEAANLKRVKNDHGLTCAHLRMRIKRCILLDGSGLPPVNKLTPNGLCFRIPRKHTTNKCISSRLESGRSKCQRSRTKSRCPALVGPCQQ
jgi:hypothetical protein